MTDTLTGIHADQFQIVTPGQVRTKPGANLAGMANALDLKIRRVDNLGGVNLITIPASVITPSPLAIPNQALTVPENPLVNTIIGQLFATGGTGTKVYGVGAGSNGAVAISPTGSISVAANILGEVAVPSVWDFEGGSTFFTIPVQVTDNTTTATGTLTVNLSNVNEGPSASNVAVTVEDTTTPVGGFVVALPAISDPDAGNTHFVDIYSGNTDGDFAILGGNLVTVNTLSVSRRNSYTLVMRIVDSGGAVGFYTITITVIAGPPIVVLTPTSGSIPETANSVSTVVSTISFVGTVTSPVLTLSGANAADFIIANGNELRIRPNLIFDRETLATRVVSVNLDEPSTGAGIDSTQAFTLTISNVAAQVSPGLTGALQTAATLGTAIATATASDGVGISVGTWSLIGVTGVNANLGYYAIGASSGTVTLATPGVGNLVAGTTVLTVQFNDTQATSTGTITITTTPSNTPPTLTLGASSGSVAADADTATPINLTTVTINDDAQGTNTLAITGAGTSILEIVAGQLRIQAGSTLTASTITATITVDDATVGSTPDDTETFTLTITPAYVAPNLTLVASSAGLADTESTSTARQLTQINNTNPNSETFVYAVSNSAFFDVFNNYGSNFLRLKAGVTLDAVTNPTITTDVTLDGNANGTGVDDTESFTLNVLPVRISPNTANLFGPNCPRILVAANLNAVDKNSNPVTIAFTAINNAVLKQVDGDVTVALNTPILLSDIRRGEYYILPTGAGTPSWTLSGTTSRGTTTGSAATITYTPATVDITTVAGSGVTSYATAETFFTSAFPASGYTIGTSYYYSGADGFVRSTAQSSYGNNTWGPIFVSPISTSAPSVSSALNNASSVQGGQYIYKEATRWRLYTLSGYGGSRTWTEQTTA